MESVSECVFSILKRRNQTVLQHAPSPHHFPWRLCCPHANIWSLQVTVFGTSAAAGGTKEWRPGGGQYLAVCAIFTWCGAQELQMCKTGDQCCQSCRSIRSYDAAQAVMTRLILKTCWFWWIDSRAGHLRNSLWGILCSKLGKLWTIWLWIHRVAVFLLQVWWSEQTLTLKQVKHRDGQLWSPWGPHWLNYYSQTDNPEILWTNHYG